MIINFISIIAWLPLFVVFNNTNINNQLNNRLFKPYKHKHTPCASRCLHYSQPYSVSHVSHRDRTSPFLNLVGGLVRVSVLDLVSVGLLEDKLVMMGADVSFSDCPVLSGVVDFFTSFQHLFEPY